MIVEIQVTPPSPGFFGTTEQKQVGTGTVTYINGTKSNYMMWGADVSTYGFAVTTKTFRYLEGTKIYMEVILMYILAKRFELC